MSRLSKEAAPRLPLPPLEFVDLIAVERVDDGQTATSSSSENEKVERFRSLATPTSPIPGIARVFGGYIYAQSAYAASKTTPKGFLIHVCRFC